MGETAAGEGRIEDARTLFTDALSLASPSDDRTTLVTIYAGRGAARLANGALQDALEDYIEALRLTRETGMRRAEMEAHQGLADVYERLGDAAQALQHFKEFARLREELLNEERQRVTAEYQARFDAVHAEHEREIYRVRAAQLEDDVRRREQELAAMALELVHENELLGTLRNRLARIRTQAPAELRVEIDAIIRDLDTSNHNSEHWKRFEQQLDLQQREFITQISQLYPVLRPMELKVAALLRLGLTSKDIALLLHTSVRNIESHRYWIRKALNLPKEQNLSAFLSSVGPTVAGRS
jgi:DNA-binding CsgD family transcriptional regulator